MNTLLPVARWRRHFDRLRVKLFLAIAGANVVLVLAAYLIYGWSFDQGLVEYLNRADEARLTPLIARLADGHRQHGGWDWVAKDRQQWQTLVGETMGFARGPRRPASGSAGSDGDPIGSVALPASGPSLPLTIDPRLLLFDAQRQLLAGSAERAPQAVLKPIVDGAVVVGHLGYVPRLQVVTSLEQVFAAQQNRKFLAIALALLVAVVLAAALIAQWLSRRLGTLGTGAAALTRGEYATRIAVQGHDELAQLGQVFNRLAQTLEATQRARQQWIADIAHELRTPLATLRAEIEALQDGVRPLNQAGLGSLAQEVARLTRLVEDLRLLSLSDLGALSCHKEMLDLGELIEDHLAVPTERPLALQLTVASGVRVLADADRMAQIFANLLQNTLRYSEAPTTLQVSLQRDGAEAHVVWQDSAPGVPAEALPRLTDRLYRVEASRARSSGGSGLGLAIVEAIVDLHGGRMQPSPGALGGLRWDLWFPLAPAAGAVHG